MKNKLKIIALLMAVMLVLCSCDKFEELLGDNSQNTEQMPVFEDDTVFSVGGVNVSYAEWLLYLQPVIDQTNSMYGDAIWSIAVDAEGKTYAQALKEEIRDKIAYVKIVCMHATDVGVSLNEDEMIDVNIHTDEYMSKLDAQTAQELGITTELVRQVYSDNQLAMKVYEHLTLNVDTYIPDDDVRYMVLQYIAIMKYKTDANGIQEEYTAEELEAVKTQAQDLSERVHAADAGVLSSFDEEVSVTELLADKEELEQNLSEQLAQRAFELSEGEKSELIETEEAYFILQCVEYSNKEMTDAAKVAIIEERQAEVFAREYENWQTETKLELNPQVWDTIQIP